MAIRAPDGANKETDGSELIFHFVETFSGESVQMGGMILS